MSLKIDKIPDGKGGFYFAFVQEDIEKVDPITYYEEYFHLTKQILFEDVIRMAAKAKGEILSDEKVKELASYIVHDSWQKHLVETVQSGIPNNLKALLSSTKKKQQVKLLKGMRFTPEQFTSFTYWSYLEEGYLYSKYMSEYDPSEYSHLSKPTFARYEKGKLEHSGDTDMTDGQIKHTIEKRKKIIATFFDRDTEWHCFFITFKSLRGEESWQEGQPHYHYISDKFGLRREDVVTELKSKNYKLNARIHIALDDYLEEE